MARVLHLTLKKKWFDMIASGEKKEEYRERKPFWHRRLNFQTYDVVEFRNGYGKKVPMMRFDLKGISADIGKKEWGAEPHEIYFVIKLGERIA
jgi:hypothetical protein